VLRLLTWNVAGRQARRADQLRFVEARSPDLVCLQEITPGTVGFWVDGLARSGYQTVETSLPEARAPTRKRQLGVLIASRLTRARPQLNAIEAPWPEKTLSVVVKTYQGEVVVHTAHIPPGSSNGWVKVETLEAIRAGILANGGYSQILTGDFNTPQLELPNGTAVTWAQRLDTAGLPRLKRQIRGGSSSRWDAAERGVLTELRAVGVRDVFREVVGYGVSEGSWAPRTDSALRRYDHILASSSLEARRCEYLHAPRLQGLSDHSALEAHFGKGATK
jgi:endonuclease/exonuclease/phosphatase family metal-dependent hydrolase